MRCFKVKQKLNALNFDNSEIAQDQMLVNHLNDCSACASLVSAEQALRLDLHSAAVDDNEEVVSNWILKAQVERQAALVNRSKFRENHLMAIFTNLIKRQSKLTIGITTVVVVLLLSVLIPFSYNQTIGYEVAFAGVDKNLAMDSDKLHELLKKLGIEGFDIDVSGCETTCNVKISDLKSPDDAKLVIAVFNEIDHVVLLDGIKIEYETKEGNIYKKLSFISEDSSISNFNYFADADADDMHNVVVKLLGDDLHNSVNVWFSDSGNCDNIDLSASSNAFFFSDENTSSMMDIKCDPNDVVASFNKDGRAVITINSGTDEEKSILLPIGGVYDEETIQQLKDMGLEVHKVEGEPGKGKNNGMVITKIIDCKTGDDLKEVNETGDDALAKSTGELPEGFELSQNYPNPFNPTTTISFTIPTSQHVSLEIINVQGQVVKTLVDQQMSAGTHSIEWDATNEAGFKVASGVYLYKLTTPENNDVKKMTLLK